ncbi:hypothetical protein SELMODRAFT_426708 [Selaginella moellendorffii]|uniref:Uncharacterized protein n=1 Tax=Selaginella moellendorffii TaxID=88036 RepID=D8SX87_SELML|nr:hypothetical protein SELMODRAFT_426708 [Selaginella moellendorffii]
MIFGLKGLNPLFDYFGNVISHASSHSTAKDLLEKPASYATDLIQASIKRLDNEYIRSQMDFVELQQKNPVQIARSGKTVLSPNLSVTSWAQLPIYELDFGYGTPVFAGGPYVPFEGISIMLPSYTRDGSIDVIIGLFEPDMAKFREICFDV